MAKPIKVYQSGGSPGLDESAPIRYNLGKQNTVLIRLTSDAIVKITGATTGRLYVFSGAGATQAVDVQDKDEILNKRRGKSCCGGQSGKPLFELV